MIDTVRVHDTTTIYVRDTILQVPSTLDALRDSQQFYSDSFDQLLVVFSLLFGIIGVLIPLGIGLYQFFRFKQQSKEINQKFVQQRRMIVGQSEAVAKQKKGIDDLEQRMVDNIRLATENMENQISSLSQQLDSKFDDLSKQLYWNVAGIWNMLGWECDNDENEFFYFGMSLKMYVWAEAEGGVSRAVDRLLNEKFSKQIIQNRARQARKLVEHCDAGIRDKFKENDDLVRRWEKLLERINEALSETENQAG